MLHGSCYCGEINFTVDEDATATGGILCHCNTCQLLHTQNSYNIKTEESKLKVTKGKPSVFADRKADSGKPIHRSFCPSCGSGLFSIPESAPGAAFIKVGALDERQSIKPVAEIYVDKALSHAALRSDKGIKHFEGMMAKEVDASA